MGIFCLPKILTAGDLSTRNSQPSIRDSTHYPATHHLSTLHTTLQLQLLLLTTAVVAALALHWLVRGPYPSLILLLTLEHTWAPPATRSRSIDSIAFPITSTYLVRNIGDQTETR